MVNNLVINKITINDDQKTFQNVKNNSFEFLYNNKYCRFYKTI